MKQKKYLTNFNELILPNIAETTFYKLSCPNYGWGNSVSDLAYFCPKCGEDLKCGRLVSDT